MAPSTVKWIASHHQTILHLGLINMVKAKISRSPDTQDHQVSYLSGTYLHSPLNACLPGHYGHGLQNPPISLASHSSAAMVTLPLWHHTTLHKYFHLSSSKQACQSHLRWTNLDNPYRGTLVKPLSRLIVTTNASLREWGNIFQSIGCQGEMVFTRVSPQPLSSLS